MGNRTWQWQSASWPMGAPFIPLRVVALEMGDRELCACGAWVRFYSGVAERHARGGDRTGPWTYCTGAAQLP